MATKTKATKVRKTSTPSTPNDSLRIGVANPTNAPKVKIKPHPAPVKVIVAPAFKNRPVGPALSKQVKQTTKAATQAKRAIAPSVLPAVPSLKHPTPTQKKASRDLYTGSRTKALGGKPSQVGPAKVKAYEKNIHTGTQRKLRRIIKLAQATSANQSVATGTRASATLSPDASKAKGTDARHTHLHLPGATIDLSSASSTIAKPFAQIKPKRIYHSIEKLGQLAPVSNKTIGGRFLNDLVDFPANTVTSTVKLAHDALVPNTDGSPKLGLPSTANPAVKEMVDSTVHIVKHPGEHPLYTLLLAKGGVEGLDRAAGRAARTKGSARVRAKYTTERPSRGIEGVEYTHRRTTKGGLVGGQVRKAVDRKVIAHRAGEKTLILRRHKDPQSPMSEHQMKTAIDETVGAGDAATKHNQARAAVDAQNAVAPKKGRGLRRRVKANAGTNLAARGIVNPTRHDLESYLAEIKTHEPSLKGERLKENRRTQKLIVKALEDFNPAEVERAARAYSDLSMHFEKQITDRNIVTPDVAEATRLAGPAVRRAGATEEALRTGTETARAERIRTAASRRQALKDLNAARWNLSRARANFRVSRATTRTSPELEAAVKARNAAVRRVAKATRDSERALERAHADARVSVAKPKSTPELKAALKARDTAIKRLSSVRAKARTGGIWHVPNPRGVTEAQLDAARKTVDTANARVRAEKARIAGVAPTEAEALRGAIHSHYDPKAIHRATGRDAIRAAESRVQAERAALRPATAHRTAALGDALRAREDALQRRTTTRETAHAARARHIAYKKTAFANADGPVSIDAIRHAMGPDAIEPAYVSAQPLRTRVAAIPANRVKPAAKVQTTGEAIRTGTHDVHPRKLIEQHVDTQRLIDSHDLRTKTLDQWSYRVDGEPKTFSQAHAAEEWAKNVADLPKTTGVKQWRAMQRNDGEYALVPGPVFDQLAAHEARSLKIPGAFAAVTGNWRKNVLVFSPRWFAGQAVEGAVRSLIAGAGAMSYHDARKTFALLDKDHPELAAELRNRTARGGHLRSAGEVVNSRALMRQTDDLKGMARAFSKFWEHPAPHTFSRLYGAWSHIVFESTNGRLETGIRTAMLGKALRNHPLMDGRVIGIAEQAAKLAAEGKFDSPVFAELGRSVNDMYGKYTAFSPGMQRVINGYTPFLPWTLNAVRFLYRVMPRDHPVLTALLADANQATEKWRKEHGVFLDIFGETPDQDAFHMGSVLGKGDTFLNVSHYMPFGVVNGADGTPVLGGLEGVLLPQISEIAKNFLGKDWKDSDLADKQNGARNALAGAVSFLEGQVPASSQIAHIVGAKLPNMSDKDQAKIPANVGVRLRKQFDPGVYAGRKYKIKAGAKNTKPTSTGTGSTSGSSYGSSTYGTSPYGASPYGSSSYGSSTYGGGG